MWLWFETGLYHGNSFADFSLYKEKINFLMDIPKIMYIILFCSITGISLTKYTFTKNLSTLNCLIFLESWLWLECLYEIRFVWRFFWNRCISFFSETSNVVRIRGSSAIVGESHQPLCNGLTWVLIHGKFLFMVSWIFWAGK